MRIAILAPESFPNLWGGSAPGGITHYVGAMAEGYAALGHDVHIFARGARRGRARWASTTVHYVRAADSSGPVRVINPLVDELRLWWSFARASQPKAFDLVEVIDWNVAAGLSIALVRHGPVLVKLHGPSAYIAKLNGAKIGRLGRLRAWRERWIARRADLLISADPFLAREMAQMWDLPSPPETIPDPVRVPTGHDPNSNRNGDPFRIVAVGKLEHRKDQATLIRALERLGDSVSWSATLVGPDTATAPDGRSYKSFLMDLASERTCSNLTWIDQLSHEQLWTLYSRCDVAVVCTVDGAFGYTTLDAMAAGCPVVTTDPGKGGESPYVRHGETAWVFRSGDDSALASALQSLSRDSSARASLGVRARVQVQHSLSPRRIGELVLEHARHECPSLNQLQEVARDRN